jgi:hypothetical protein
MKVRSVPLIAVVFGAAALAAAFVVSQLPYDRRPADAPAAQEGATPRIARAAGERDGKLEVRVSAGPEPLAGAAVRLYAALPTAPGEPDVAWRVAAEGTTERDGVARIFAFPGSYLVVVRGAGLAPARVEAIRSREPLTRLEVVLEPPIAFSGRVVTREGAPVSGARVRAVPLASRWPPVAPPSAPAEEISEATTGADGAFRIDGLAPGSYALSAEARGSHPALVSRAELPEPPRTFTLEPLGAVAGVVLLPDGRAAPGARVQAASVDHDASAVAGDDGRFTLAVPAGSYQVVATAADRAVAAPSPVAVAAGSAARGVELRLGAAATLEGEARRGDAPAAGATVALSLHGARAVVARSRADAAGRFRVAGLAPGAYDVRAWAPGASPSLTTGVTLGRGARFPLRLALSGMGAIEGVVSDEAGRPLASVRVRAVSRGDGLATAGALEARTDFEGRFRLDAVEVGRAEVVARQDGVLAGVSHAVRVDEGRATHLELSLPDSGVLQGRVSAGRGAPPAGTTVLATPMRAGLGSVQVARTATDATGNYTVRLPAGEYRVEATPGDASAGELRSPPAFTRVEAARTTRLDLAAAGARGETGLEILVLEPGGAPSPGAVVTLARAGDPKIALATSAGDDGRVVLAGTMGFAGQRATIRAHNGGRSGALTMALPATGTVSVTLAPGGALSGVVRGAGRPVSGFTLEIASQPAPERWRTIDVHRFAGDRFELADLPSEPLRVTVRADDGRRGDAEVRLGAGEARAVEIALR